MRGGTVGLLVLGVVVLGVVIGMLWLSRSDGERPAPSAGVSGEETGSAAATCLQGGRHHAADGTGEAGPQGA